ncbi:hypothetical protein CPLU01_07378 [Colletotrichum plurivorum]|uniref:Uncharacterized protein n=1 Tax=Colletotrichum plurivorum TaxID=2175906 RepID=A0A8H6KFD4_9PEZI|nr:hypothetical protein CPLU01_07378 [Colletotrichum plurivorum]
MIIHDGGRSSARSSSDEPLIAKSMLSSQNERTIPSKIAAQEFSARHVDLPKCRLSCSTPALPKQTSINAGVTDRVEAHQHMTKKTSRTPSIMRLWFWELVTLVFAAVLLGVILSILFHADNRPQDDWSLPFNINFFLATLSTIYRALLISISAAALAQFKWIWFWSKRSPARPLGHISAFDDACRGILGAVKLIPIVIIRDFACIPPLLIIIFSFAVGPLVQQAVDLRIRTVVLSREIPSSIPVSQTVEGLGADEVEDDGSGNLRFRARTRGFIYSVLGNPQSNHRGVQATCDTRYCSFTTRYQRLNGQPTHASVGFCAHCTDLTPLVTVVDKTHGELPNGMAVGGNNVMMIKTDNDLSWIRENRDPTSEMRRRFAFANVTYLIRAGTLAPNDTSFDPTNSPSFAAGSCSLWPCLQYFGADVINGTLFEDKVRAEPMFPDAIEYSGDDLSFLEAPANRLPAEWDLTAVQSLCRVNNSVYDWGQLDTPFGRLNRLVNDTKVRLLGNPEGFFNGSDVPVKISTIPGPCVFRMARSFHSTMASFLSEDIFNGTCSHKTTAAGSAVVDCGMKWWPELFWANSTSSGKDFETHMMDFADWMTTELRAGRLGLKTEGVQNFHGWALANINYTVIRWRWLLFPLAMLIAEDHFVTSDGQFLKKEKVQEISRADDSRLMTNDEMEQAAQDTRVKLLRGGPISASLIEMAPWIPSIRRRGLIDETENSKFVIR